MGRARLGEACLCQWVLPVSGLLSGFFVLVGHLLQVAPDAEQVLGILVECGRWLDVLAEVFFLVGGQVPSTL